MRLNGKKALVTGAGRGIGAAIATAYAREGARVWISDVDLSAARNTAKAIGPDPRCLRLDVREPSEWAAAEAEINDRDGGLDILVNNAGITGLEDGRAHGVDDVTLDDWRAVLATNLEGVMLGCQAAIRLMSPSGGAIINIASRSGHIGIPAAAAYAASKAAALNHTRSVALYCAERDLNIRCNSISPAAVLTPMWEPMLGEGPERETSMAALVSDTPLQRFADPEEVAALAVMLAGDEATYMTGSDLTLDGGLLAGSAARLG